jgi:hypothetical protein
MAQRLSIRDQWLGVLSLEPINDGLERIPRAGFRLRARAASRQARGQGAC